MSNAYVIEASGETAGIVVRVGQRFRFLSSSPRFWSVDGNYYRSPKEAERAARAMIMAVRVPSTEPARTHA